jgi:hypothetical protein
MKTTLKGQFEVGKVASCGSDANLFALTCASDGDTSSCLLAAGSYVSGDGGPLQHMSTSAFQLIGFGLTLVTPPEKVSVFTREHTIALPYYLPTGSGFATDGGLLHWENLCFEALHSRCLQAKMQGTPYKVLLLELMLAGSGATLHDRALRRLAALADLHSIRIVVDEIMTGGRTGTILFLQQKPLVFQKVVTHVTLGKWIGLGVVLVKPKIAKVKEDLLLNHSSRRGTSTGIECWEAIAILKAVIEHLPQTQARRAIVLQRLQIKEEEAWGCGILIFAPVARTDHCMGLKNRFLPLISEHTRVDKVPLRRSRSWTPAFFHHAFSSSLKAWTELESSPTHHKEENKADTLLCNWFVGTNQAVNTLLTTKQVTESVFKGTAKGNTVREVLRRAEAAGMVTKTVRKKQRLRYWMVNKLAVLPATDTPCSS